jgi:large subunit ribosomal protein L4
MEEIQIDQPKTKSALGLLAALQLESKTLFIDSVENKNLQLSVRNLENAKFSSTAAFNVVDALKYKNLVISKQAFQQLTKILGQ